MHMIGRDFDVRSPVSTFMWPSVPETYAVSIAISFFADLHWSTISSSHPFTNSTCASVCIAKYSPLYIRCP